MEKRIVLLLVSFLMGLSGKAQQQQQRPSKDEQVKYLSKTLSVDQKKAEEIVLALEYNTEKIRTAARDTSMHPRQRQELLRKLQQERQAKLAATLSPAQLARLQAPIASKVQAQKEKTEKHTLDMQQKMKETRVSRDTKKQDKKP